MDKMCFSYSFPAVTKGRGNVRDQVGKMCEEMVEVIDALDVEELGRLLEEILDLMQATETALRFWEPGEVKAMRDAVIAKNDGRGTMTEKKYLITEGEARFVMRCLCTGDRSFDEYEARWLAEHEYKEPFIRCEACKYFDSLGVTQGWYDICTHGGIIRRIDRRGFCDKAEPR